MYKVQWIHYIYANTGLLSAKVYKNFASKERCNVTQKRRFNLEHGGTDIILVSCIIYWLAPTTWPNLHHKASKVTKFIFSFFTEKFMKTDLHLRLKTQF